MSAGPAAEFHRLCRLLSPFSSAQTAAAMLPVREIDWAPLVAMADRQYVLSELHPVLQRHGLLDAVPSRPRDMFEAAFDIVVGRNADLRAQLAEITDLLGAIGVTPIWLKGAVYLTQEDWWRRGRIMGDLDFWVPDVEKQKATLSALDRQGYRPYKDGSEERWRSLHHYGPRFHPERPAQIEIHRHIVRPTVAALLPDAATLVAVVRREWQGRTIAHLAYDDRIMHSLVQCTVMATPAFRRARPRLMKYLDLAGLMENGPGPELPAPIVSRIGRRPWRTVMARFLTFAEQELGISNPLETDRWFVERIDCVFAHSDRLPVPQRIWEVVRRRLLGRAF